MTDEQLAAQCPHGCGRTVGQHLVPFHRDDCTWANDARCSTYDRAEDRYYNGLWTLDQWEAFQRLHTYSRDKWWPAESPEVARYVRLLDPNSFYV
jgi:hypothetical protein